MHSEYTEAEPPGFVKIQKVVSSTKSSRGHRFEILLPHREAERMEHEEKMRQDKATQALLDEKPQELARQAAAPPSVMQSPKDEKAKPEAEVAAKTFVLGVDYDPQLDIR